MSQEKVTIHNPLPESEWPYKPGAKVYYLVTRLVVGAPWIANGKVIWYQPDRHLGANACPSLTINVMGGSDFGSAQIVAVENVRLMTKKGFRELVEIMANFHESSAVECDKCAAEHRMIAAFMREGKVDVAGRPAKKRTVKP